MDRYNCCSKSLALITVSYKMMMVPEDAGISVVGFAPFLDSSNEQAVANAILAFFKRVESVYLLDLRRGQSQYVTVAKISSRMLVINTPFSQAAAQTIVKNSSVYTG
ncbi:hypothetical protein DFH09DRAFT_1315689 [Mycena vulgaris]|nr:hypothetical protein DFH09DRAFT_1315689 [Mycena vulgaris]